MPKIPFIRFHSLSFLHAYDMASCPLDVALHRYFKEHRALGSKDRASVAREVYGVIRHLGLIDWLCKEAISFEKRLDIASTLNPDVYIEREEIPPHIRVSFPKGLFHELTLSFSPDEALRLAALSNKEAPTVLRANTLKITREALMEKLKDRGLFLPCKIAENGILCPKRMAFTSFPEFKEGLFEIQDEGSQLIAAYPEVKSGDLVLDYCSGSGGKALAIASEMKNKGQLYLHDIRKGILIEAKKRLCRAGVQNAQTILPHELKMKHLEKKIDLVVVDAPCSGTGTLRRNPDIKWKFTEESLNRLIQEQRNIFKEALSYLAPKGKILYATCSLLKKENDEQVSYFLANFPLHLTKPPLQLLPLEGGCDGFFGAIFSKTNP